MIDLGWTDNCDGSGTVTGTDVSNNGSCPEIITRTWTYTDACGNVATVTQTITINDTTPPTASNPTPISIAGGAPPAPDVNVVIDEADNCTAAPTVTLLSDISDGGECPEIIARTYRITDDCGNTTDVVQTITIGDAIMPTASNPAPINVECLADVPASDPLVVTDETDNGAAPIVTWEDDTSDGNSCPEIITRRYRVTDDCGNFIFVTQTITIQDITIPILNAAPADVNVQCIGDIPTMTDLVWTDNCDGSGTVTGTDAAIVGSNCGGTITRTWTYTDACSNAATATQTITVNDTQAPILAAVPVDATVQCIGDIPAMTDLGWTDNCDGAGTVTGTDAAIVGGNCGGTITRTWTYTDACGNVATTTQTITVDDNVAPVMAAVPADITVECPGDVPAMVDLGWTDNCDGAGTVTGTDSPLTGACGGTIIRTWTYTDACGNVATVTQTITVDDTTLPTASDPVTTTVPGGPAPTVDITVVIDEADNCTLNPVVVFVSESTDGVGCPETITRIYSVTDDCGNTINVTHTILITDPFPPTASNPAQVNVECLGDVPAPDVTIITDEADNGSTPTVAWEDDTSDGNTCPEIITRRYRVTDDCGNFIFVSQTITVGDITAPVLTTAPANVTVQCIGDAAAMTDLAWTDNCDGSGTVTGTDAPIVGNTCGGTITRTWTYSDACGNNAIATQTITISLTTPPIVPSDDVSTVECMTAAVQPAAPVVTDACGNNITAAITANADPSCAGDKVYTFTYTDCAGNTSAYTYTYTIDLTTAPIVPANGSESVECISDVYVPTAPTVTDACGNNLVPAMTENADPVCVGDKVYTFTYTDCANQIYVYTYTFTINDNIPPTASNPAPTSVPGALDIPIPDINVVTDEADNCTLNPVVAWVSDVSDGSTCDGEIITRTYSITDDCGNQTLITQEITIMATYPLINAGPDQTICIGDDMTLTAINPLGCSVLWDIILDGVSFTPTQTGTYTVTADNLGCITTDEVIVMVATPPAVSFEADVTSDCAPLVVTFTNTTPGTLIDCIWEFSNGTTSNGCNTVTTTFENGGYYDVTLTTTLVDPLLSNSGFVGCTASATYTDYIYVEDLPEASFVPSSNTLTNFMTTVQFDNTSTGAVNYVWDFGDGAETSTVTSPLHDFPSFEEGTYTVELVAYSPLNCTDTAITVIIVEEQLIFYVPNTFTPDGDSYNEFFTPVFSSGYDPYDFTLLIFNRWGAVIWESHDASVGWDATYGSHQVQDGTYTWKIEFKTLKNDERITSTGHVNVTR